MSSPPERPVEACLIDLFQQLGLDKAQIAAGWLGLTDWHGLATRRPDRVASLTLIHPPILELLVPQFSSCCVRPAFLRRISARLSKKLDGFWPTPHFVKAADR
jgi:hypothetical protein